MAFASYVAWFRGLFGDNDQSTSSGRPVHYHVYGFPECPYFSKAVCVGNTIVKAQGKQVRLFVHPLSREEYANHLRNEVGNGWNTCPVVMSNERKEEANDETRAPRMIPYKYNNDKLQLVGGYSEFLKTAQAKYKVEPKC